MAYKLSLYAATLKDYWQYSPAVKCFVCFPGICVAFLNLYMMANKLEMFELHVCIWNMLCFRDYNLVLVMSCFILSLFLWGLRENVLYVPHHTVGFKFRL